MVKLPLYRVILVRESAGRFKHLKATCSMTAYRALRPFFKNLDREQFMVCCLDSKLTIIAVNVVAVGSLNSTVVHPREVFKPAILSNASSVIVAHNHPSGDPTPSQEDFAVTLRLQEAGEVLGIKLIDSLVIGNSSYRTIIHKRCRK